MGLCVFGCGEGRAGCVLPAAGLLRHRVTAAAGSVYWQGSITQYSAGGGCRSWAAAAAVGAAGLPVLHCSCFFCVSWCSWDPHGKCIAGYVVARRRQTSVSWIYLSTLKFILTGYVNCPQTKCNHLLASHYTVLPTPFPNADLYTSYSYFIASLSLHIGRFCQMQHM
jgi:hypothetical protein